MNRILIVGAESFIGKYLYDELKINNYDVLGTCLKKNHKYLSYLDIFENSSYLNILKKYQPEIIISLAWNTSKGFWNSETNKTYYEAYLNFIKTAFKNKIKLFVGVGTSAEYGDINFNCQSLKTVPNPTTLYGFYKLQTAIALMKIAAEFNSNFLWLRLFQVYGRGEKEFRLLPTLINYMKSKNNPPLSIENPNKVLDWVHVTDVVNALNFLLKNNVNNEVIDVGTSIGNSVNEMIEKLEFASDFKFNLKFEHYGGRKGLVCSSSIKLLELGWKPKFNLEKGLEKYIEEVK